MNTHKEYKVCTELIGATPEIIRAWNEKIIGNVYIVNVESENVSRLADIHRGQECTRRVLDEFRDDPNNFNNDLLSPKTMDMYYRYYFHDRKTEMNYTLSKPYQDKSMYDLLSRNSESMNAFVGRNNKKSELMLKQAFKTAGSNFRVIDQKTIGLIVPYEKGADLITLINGECDLSELKQYLKSAQQFSVNLFEADIRKLEEVKGIVELKNGGVMALADGFYINDLGVTFEKQPLEFFNY